MQEKSVITRTITTAAGVYAPGHLGGLTQIVDFALVDAVLEETGAREKRLLPSRVVVYLVLALALFEDCSYRSVWGKLTAALDGLTSRRPAASSLARARRRIGAAPLRRLFEVLAGPVADRGQAGSTDLLPERSLAGTYWQPTSRGRTPGKTIVYAGVNLLTRESCDRP